MSNESKTQYFDEKDLKLLESVLELVPDLDIVAYAAKLARDRVKYPVQDHAGFLPLFGKGKSAQFKDRQITFEDVERFLPKDFFPIASERDLLCKLLIAFQRGRVYHLQENIRSQQPRVISPNEKVTHLPSPSPFTSSSLM